MSKYVRASLAMLSVLLISLMPAVAQEVFRSEPTPPMTGQGGTIGAGGLGPSQSAPDLHSTLSGPMSAPRVSSPNLEAPRAAAPALSSPAAGGTASQSTPQPSPLLLSAHSSGDGGGGECDITAAARQSCSGAGCLLSCPSDACAGQESDKCEFVIDCVAEIAADVASDDQQCDEQYIEHTTYENGGNATPVTIVRIPVGQTCKPPPCMK